MDRMMRAILIGAAMLFVTACAGQGGSGGSSGQDIAQTTDNSGTTTGQGTTDGAVTDEGSTDLGTTDEGTTDEGSADEGTTDEGVTAAGVTDEGTTGQQVNGDPGSLNLLIRALVNGDALLLGNAYDAGGQKFDINKFRYWLSNVELIAADGTNYVVPESYYLMEQTSVATREDIALSGIPAGDYTGITFAVGVDPPANASLDFFAGELTTAVNMDWGWKQGFVFFKIEGNFLNGAEMKFYKMHVGTNPNFKSMTLNFDMPIRVDGAHQAEVAIDANLEKVYETIDLSKKPITTYHPHSAQIAGGYATMFTLFGAESNAQ